jgi:hypothetical protein
VSVLSEADKACVKILEDAEKWSPEGPVRELALASAALVRRLATRVSELEGDNAALLAQIAALESCEGASPDDSGYVHPGSGRLLKATPVRMEAPRLCGSCGVDLAAHRPGATCGDPKPPRATPTEAPRTPDTACSHCGWAKETCPAFHAKPGEPYMSCCPECDHYPPSAARSTEQRCGHTHMVTIFCIRRPGHAGICSEVEPDPTTEQETKDE